MKHTFHIIRLSFFILIAAFMLNSCDKVPMNGQLDGMWQIMTVQTAAGTHDAKADCAYLSIQLHLCQWDQLSKANQNGHVRFYSHFRREGDNIIFYDFAKPSLHRSNLDDNEMLTNDEMETQKLMGVWCVYHLNDSFHIRELNSENLVLEREDTVIHFRKF